MLDSLSDGSPVSVPYFLVSEWTSGFKNETHRVRVGSDALGGYEELMRRDGMGRDGMTRTSLFLSFLLHVCTLHCHGG